MTPGEPLEPREPEFFSKCTTSTQQIAWIHSRMLPCPFCGGTGNGLVVHPSRGGDDLWEIGCRDFACVSPRACHQWGDKALEKWNRRAALSASPSPEGAAAKGRP